MTRRITIPEDHVALILPSQLADELMSILSIMRRESARHNRRVREKNPEFGPTDMADKREAVCGDVMLALLEAKEA